MDFSEISKTHYYLTSHLLRRPHLTVCAQCDVTMTSEFDYIRVKLF